MVGKRTTVYKRPKPQAKKPIDKAQNNRIRKLEYAMKNSRELKSIDNNANVGVVVPNTGQITSFGIPSNGDLANNRDGDEIFVHGVDFRMQIVNNGTATTMTRVILYLDLKNIVSTASAILDTTGNTLAPLSHFARENRNLYKVVYDRTFLTDAVKQGQVLVKFNKKFKRPKKQVYAPGTNNPTCNVFKMLIISDLSVGLGAPSIDMVMREYFTD